ncbi:Homeodomain-like protein, partial [Blakeslea trispora]
PFSDKEGSAPRKRTRATPEQLAILEKSFDLNPSPNNRVREQLSRDLGMSERSIQIWFQNRRAKVKNVAKKTTMLQDETLRMQRYASTAAAAACQAAAYREQQLTGEQKELGNPIKSNTDLYYYYYYYYFNQQQSNQRQKHPQHHSSSSSSSIPPPPISLKTMPPPPP